MALPEYITAALAAGGPVALTLIALRFGPDAVVRLLAGAVASLTHDDKRGERALKVLSIMRNRNDEDPPESPKLAELSPRDDAQVNRFGATSRLGEAGSGLCHGGQRRRPARWRQPQPLPCTGDHTSPPSRVLTQSRNAREGTEPQGGPEPPASLHTTSVGDHG